MAHHAVARPAGVFFVALVLLHFLPMSRDCGVIGILLSLAGIPPQTRANATVVSMRMCFAMGIPLWVTTFLCLNSAGARLIPMSTSNGADASSPPQSPSVSCFGLTGPQALPTFSGIRQSDVRYQDFLIPGPRLSDPEWR